MRAILTAIMLAAAIGGDAAAQPAPDATRATVEAIARIGAATSPSFSPDGRRIAYVSRESGTPQVWVASADGAGAPVQVTRLTDPVLSVDWSPVGETLAFAVAPGGGLNVQVYTAAADGSGLKRITAGGEDNNQLGGWTHDGRRLMIVSNKRDPAGFDSLLVDPVSGAETTVARDGYTQLADVARDGRRAVVERLRTRGDSDLVLASLAGGAEALLTPHEGRAEFGWGELSPDGRRVYVLGNGGRDMAAFGVVELDAAGRPSAVRWLAERADADGEAAALDRQGRRAAILWNVGGRSELELLDVATGRRTPVARLPGDLVSAPTWSEDGSKLAMVISGASLPADVHVLDVASGRVTQVTRSRHDGVDLAALVRPELVRYRGLDGLEQSGWLYRARGARGPGPVVFNFHGGPEGQSRPTLSPDIQALAARGISTFAPNVRGSSGFGKRFMELDNGAKRVDGVRDMKSAVDHLVKAGIADPKRAGVMGGSYGGYMVMAGVTEFPELFAAGANLFGIVNFETFFSNTQPWMAAISTVEYGDPVREKAMLASLSPIGKLDRIRTPLLVLHGANDTNVPVIEAEQIVASLKGRNVPVEYILFPDEGHGWRKQPNRVRSTLAITDFFDRHLNAPAR